MSRKPQLKVSGLKTLEAYINQFEDKQSALIKILYEAQHLFGYLSEDVMMFISEKTKAPASKIYGVVSFYSYFTTKPKGKSHVKICLGTACFVRGAKAIAQEFEQELGVKMGETTEDRKFSLESVRCVGACGLAPVVMVDDKVYGKVEKQDITTIIKSHQD